MKYNKKIIFFIATLCSGGAERVVSILSHELVERGYVVEILTYFNELVFYKIDDRVHILSVVDQTNSSNFFRNILWIRSYLKKNASIVVSFLAKFNMTVLFATVFTNIPVIVSERTDPRRGSWFYRFIRDKIYLLAKHVIVQSQLGKNYFLENSNTKITVIYNPVDVRFYAGKALSTNKEKIIVSVGRLIPVKNQKMIIMAFSEIHKQFPDYKMVIYGEGPSRKELEILIRNLGLEKKISLPGNITNIFEKLMSAELFVLSSEYEGMPNALLEAMCIGLPVISTKVSGAVDVINNKVNGILIDNNSILQLASAMSQLLTDQNTRYKYAVNATELCKILNVDNIIQKWTIIIEEEINNAQIYTKT